MLLRLVIKIPCNNVPKIQPHIIYYRLQSGNRYIQSQGRAGTPYIKWHVGRLTGFVTPC